MLLNHSDVNRGVTITPWCDLVKHKVYRRKKNRGLIR